MRKLVQAVDRVFAALERRSWIPLLVARLAMAGEFVQSGWDKLHDLDSLTSYFVELGIPMPHVSATATATTELVGGLLLLVGLGTRFAAVALTVVMTVAIVTAKLDGVHTVSDFFYLSEPCYIVIFLVLIFQGPGAVSADRWIARRRQPAA